MKTKTEKIYCYVDETGQDARSDLFIVAVITTKENRDKLAKLLEKIEKETGKQSSKWLKTKPDIQIAYLERILNDNNFKNTIHYSITVGITSYRDSTLVAIATAVNSVRNQEKYKTAIFIDGLRDSEVNVVGVGLRRMGVRVEKVRGVRDESSTLIRLADATAGLVRRSHEGVKYAEDLYKLGVRNSTLKRLK